MEDTYTCPQGHELKPAPSTYTHRNATKPEYKFTFKKYRTSACRECPTRELCTRNKTNVRHIERSEHDGAIHRNKERIDKKQEIYKKDKPLLNTHMMTERFRMYAELKVLNRPLKGRNRIIRFGWESKRQWGFDHVMTKRYKERASADIGLVMFAYNLRRIFNILIFSELSNFLIKLGSISQKWSLKTWWWIRTKYCDFFDTYKRNTRIQPQLKFSSKLEVSF